VVSFLAPRTGCDIRAAFTVISWCVASAMPSICLAQSWVNAGLEPDRIVSIAAGRSNPMVLYAGSASDFSAGSRGSIYKTSNGGIVWDTLLRSVSVVDLDLHPSDDRTLYASLGLNSLTQSSLIKTTDGGLTWSRADSGMLLTSEVGLRVTAINPNTPDMMYAGTGGLYGGRLYKSTNAGRSWSSIGDGTPLQNGISAIGIDPTHPSEVYVGTFGSGNVMRSTDNGETWTITTLAAPILTISFDQRAEIVYMAGNWVGSWSAGVFRTIDGGNSWDQMRLGLPDTFNIRRIEISGLQSQKELFLCGQWNDQGGVYECNSDGEWIKIGIDDTPVYTICLAGESLFAGSHGVFRRDATVGVWDQHKRPPREESCVAFPNPFNSSVTVSFRLSIAATVHISIYDILGKEMYSTILEKATAGSHALRWTPEHSQLSRLSCGVLICVIRYGHSSQATKLLYLK
jgi:photosystem II stability/assembly factor-like uncharacterized protein